MRLVIVEITMGHDIGISESYYKPTEREILDDYLNAVDILLIDNDKLTLQKQVADLKEKSKEKNSIIKVNLLVRENEIQLLRQRDSLNTDATASPADQLAKVMQDIQILKNQRS